RFQWSGCQSPPPGAGRDRESRPAPAENGLAQRCYAGGRYGMTDDLAYLIDNIHLTSVGIDVGSSPMQVMFSAIHLHREALALSTRYTVQSREMLAQSPVELTPYLGDGFIDAEQVGQFVRGEYGRAGLDPGAVDTGAILLTGEALRQRNARA